MNYIAIDFETANQNRNSACSVGLVRFVDGKEADSVYSLIKPVKMYFIPEWTRDIHQISYDDVREKPRFAEVWDTLVTPFINQTPGVPLVAHNAPFDMGVIRACCEWYEMEKPALKYFDSLRVAKKVWPHFDCHRLTALGERFGIAYNAHDALDDSRTCGKIIALAAQELGARSVEELLAMCGEEFGAV